MSMQVIQHIEVDGTAPASITFSSIPQTYTDLYLVASVRSTTSNLTFEVSPNASGTNKSRRTLQGSGSTITSGTASTLDALSNSSAFTANTFASSSIYIPNYTGSSNKSFSFDSVTETNGTTSYQRIMAGLWSDTTAISSLQCATSAGNLAQYSSFTLYGITAGSDGTTTVS